MEGVLQQSPVAVFIGVLTIATSLIAWQYGDLFKLFALNPWSLVRERHYYTFLTSGLIHADVGHLFFNMFSFYFFALPLEQLMGHWQFLTLYAASLVLSDISTVVKHKDNPDYFCVGASGAVTAAIFSFIIYEPRASIYLMLIPIAIPAPLFGIAYVAYSYYSSRYRQTRINHAAHLWGAVSGLVLTLILAPSAYTNFVHALTVSTENRRHSMDAILAADLSDAAPARILIESGLCQATLDVEHPAMVGLKLRDATGSFPAQDLLSQASGEAQAVGAYSYVVDAKGVRYESRRSTGHRSVRTEKGLQFRDIRLASAEGKTAPMAEDWDIEVTPAGALRWRITRRWEAPFAGIFSGAPALFFNSRPTAQESRGRKARENPAANGVITSLWFDANKLHGYWSPLYWNACGKWPQTMFAHNLCVTVTDADAWAVVKLYTGFPLDVDLRLETKGHLYRRGSYDRFSELGAVAAIGETFSAQAGQVEATGLTISPAPKYDTGHQLAVKLPDAESERALKRYYSGLLNGGVMCDQKIHDFGNETDGWRVGFTPLCVAMAMAAGVPAAQPVSSQPITMAQAMREAISMRLEALQPDGAFHWGFTHEPGRAIIENQTSLPLMAEAYILHTGDAESARLWFPRLELALGICIRNAEGNGGLVGWTMDSKAAFPNWYFDGIKAGGTLAYHNVVYYAALRAMARLAEISDHPDRQARYEALAAGVKAEFNRRFWSEAACGDGNPAYFDWVDGAGAGHGHFMSLVQYPAIVFGLASAEQAKKMLDTADRRLSLLAKEFGYQGDGTLDLLWPVPNEICAGAVKSGFGKYQNGGMLLTLTYWEIVARARAGDAAGAWDRLHRFAAHAARTNWFEGENSFTIDGKPFGWGSEPYLCDQVTVPAALVKGILGVEMDWHELKAKPALPPGWDRAEAEVMWKGKRYRIIARRESATVEPLHDRPPRPQ